MIRALLAKSANAIGGSVNLLLNSNPFTSTANWTANNATLGYSNGVLSVNDDGAYGSARQVVNLSPNTSYKISGTIYTDGTALQEAIISVGQGNLLGGGLCNDLLAGATITTTTPTYVEGIFTTGNDAEVTVSLSSVNDNISYFKDVVLEPYTTPSGGTVKYKNIAYGVNGTQVDVTGLVANGDIIVLIMAEYQRDVSLSTTPTGFTSLLIGAGAGTYEINNNVSWKVADGTETVIGVNNGTDTQYSAVAIIIEGGTTVNGFVSETFTASTSGLTIACGGLQDDLIAVGIKMEGTTPLLTTADMTKLNVNSSIVPRYHIGYSEQVGGSTSNRTVTSGDDGTGQWHLGFYIK